MSRVLALLLLLSLPSCLLAHTRSESYSSWAIDGKAVHITLSLPDAEANRLSTGKQPASDPQLIEYLSARVGASAAGHACAPSRPPRPVPVAPGFRRFEFELLCSTSKQLELHSDAFFEIVPTHVNLAQIELTNGDFIEQVLSTDHRRIDLGASDGAAEGASITTFIGMGIMHIFTGVDHMSFLVGLVLISRRLRDLTFVVTGFTLGHSLTLALAVTGVIRPHAEFIDALVALTIALIGVENLAVATGRARLLALWTGGVLAIMFVLRLAGFGLLPPLLLLGAGLFAANYLMVSGNLRDAGRVRVVVTLVFGLIHGFGFAADLLETRLPVKRLAELLFGFNLGVEIGQLTIVLMLTGVVYVLSRLHLALPRALVVDGVASGLVGIGVYWLVSRSFA